MHFPKPLFKLFLPAIAFIFFGIPAVAQECAPVPGGMVSWWPGDGTATDLSSANHGILVGNTTYSSGKAGQTFSFDGSEDIVRVGNPTSLQLQNFTIEAWVKRDSTDIASYGDYGNGHIFGYGYEGYVFMYQGDGTMALNKVGSSSVSYSTFQVANTNWHHVAVTKNGTAVVFFLDGVAYNSSAFSGVFSFTTEAAIGGRADNLGNSLLGAIDEIAIYNRALSASEIQAIYNASSAGKCSAVPPSIAAQPQSQAVFLGQNATFSVSASGSRPLSYQWLKDGDDINTATNASFTILNVQTNDPGSFSVIVSNDFGSITSSDAILTLTNTRQIIISATNHGWYSSEGSSNSRSEGAGYFVGKSAYDYYAEFRNWFVFEIPDLSLPIIAAELRANALHMTSPSESETYELRSVSTPIDELQTGGYGRTDIYDDLGDGYVYGEREVFTWETEQAITIPLNSTFISLVAGGQSIALGGRITTLSSDYEYGEFLFGDSDASDTVQLILTVSNTPAPFIVSQPVSQTTLIGSTVAFSVGARGIEPLSYQWQFNETDLPDATNSSLSLTGVNTNETGNYRVLVTNEFGSATSSVAALTVTNFLQKVITATDFGTYSDEGYQDSSSGYYIAGDHPDCSYCTSSYRNWFIFILPETLPGQPVGAVLRVNSFSGASPTGSKVYQLREVSTVIDELRESNYDRTDIFDDLGDGTVYGQKDVSVTQFSGQISIPLNSDFLASLTNGVPIALGGKDPFFDTWRQRRISVRRFFRCLNECGTGAELLQLT